MIVTGRTVRRHRGDLPALRIEVLIDMKFVARRGPRAAQVSDPRLRERLAAEWASASKEKKFGLVFEDHLPELLPLLQGAAAPWRSGVPA
jgi:hypothetical protein